QTLAEKSVWRFIEEHKPLFDVITILPSYVFGPKLLQEKGEIPDGTNGYIWGLLKGGLKTTMKGMSVHVLDVADAHVRALDERIAGNQRFIVNCGDIEYNDAINVAKNNFPNEEWNFGDVTTTHNIKVKNFKARDILKIDFKPFETQVLDLITQ
ncbi:hypothetical protein NADFUDRAFT_6945, partial [Nadsonia fulvescens var. elongata DSM 6958]